MSAAAHRLRASGAISQPTSVYATLANSAASAGPGLDDDVEAEALEALCGVRGGGHPALARVDLLRDADLHVA
jgi:hypothetical protein